MIARKYYIDRLVGLFKEDESCFSDSAEAVVAEKNRFLGNNINELISQFPYQYRLFNFEVLLEMLSGKFGENCIGGLLRRNQEVFLPNVTLNFSWGTAANQYFRIEVKDSDVKVDFGNNTTDDAFEIILRINESFPLWLEEWKEIFSESIKLVKKLQIDKITLETLVLSKLKGSGYEYRIEYAKTKAVLFVKSGSYQISIDITYSKMIEIVKDLPELLRNAINMLNQLPKNVKISQTDKKRVEWKTM